ncbi:unnamed protein product [Lactuca saligna]|uniref:Uncharacterized protein n=1 Tax=Lactuca saligna TaxID=75948 RepID=A0AA35Y2Q5_LACSI|nr:unnamed protein product [Lactuca saligna]
MSSPIMNFSNVMKKVKLTDVGQLRLDGGGSSSSLTKRVPDFNHSTFRELLAKARDEQEDRTGWNRPEPDRNREPASAKIKNRTGPAVLSILVLPVPGSYRFLSCLQMLEPTFEK